MGLIDYLLIAGIVLIFGAIIFFVVRSKKKGKKCIGCPDSGSCGTDHTHGCSGNCGGCSGHCSCGSELE